MKTMIISERLRAVRRALHMTQAEFGAAIRLSGSYIADMENDHRQINDRTIRLVALNFGASEAWLKTGEGDMFVRSPEEKQRRVMNLFDSLRPEFQDFALKQLDQLLELQNYES